MTLQELLSQLEGVRQRGIRHVALCPVHKSRSLKLQITAGETGVLVKCWTGCSLEAVCCALGIKPADLFYDAGIPRGQRPAPQPPRLNRIALAFRFELHALDLRMAADTVLDVARNVSQLRDHDLDDALARVGQAYADRDRAELLETVADDLRTKAFHERTGV